MLWVVCSRKQPSGSGAFIVVGRGVCPQAPLLQGKEQDPEHSASPLLFECGSVDWLMLGAGEV